MKLYSLNISNVLFVSIKGLIFLLLIFGQAFTKINVVGPFYLYDLILLFLFLFSFLGLNTISKSNTVLLFILVGFISVLFSLILGNQANFVFRQGMILGYLVITFFIFEKLKNKSRQLVKFIFKLSKVAVYIQVGYLLFILLSGENIFNGFNYFSPAVVLLFPVYAARVLIYGTNNYSKAIEIIFILFVSTMMGHSSAFLAVLTTVFGFFILKISAKQFLMAGLIVLALVLSMYFLLPQFQDVNANWRLYYWGIGLNNTLNTTLIMGNGFGVPFITDQQIQGMIEVFGGSNDFLSSQDEKFVKAYHNSFITMFFHMGVFSFLLIGPYIKGIKRLVFGEKNKELIFLIISLLGISVWVSFNVILELPHSSLIFWLIFLLTSNQLKIANES